MTSFEQLAKALGCSEAVAKANLSAFEEVCNLFAINTPKRLAAFTAQVGHETLGLKFVKEIWGPTATQKGYEFRQDLGNVNKGDGQKYCGRGWIQTTGRYNYQALTTTLRRMLGDQVPDFVKYPEMVESPKWAALAAGVFWNQKGLNAICDTIKDEADFKTLTKKINGGLNGIEDRLYRWKISKTVFNISEKTMPLPAIAAALLPTLIDNIPKLAKLFGSGVSIAEAVVPQAETVIELVKTVTKSANIQEAVEKINADPIIAKEVSDAIDIQWPDLVEAGSGGIAGARQADKLALESKASLFYSPSFVVALALLPLVYMIVGSVVGLFGAEWPPEVRAAIAGTVTGSVLGGIIGYYYGQTTSHNKPHQG